jgi:hypothetical protein
MSHLSILPTVVSDLDHLVATLEELGASPHTGDVLEGFHDERVPVAVKVCLEGEQLGWQRQPDGSLAVVGDLQRLSRSLDVQRFLAAVTRSYAARVALAQAMRELPQAHVHLAA